MDCKHSDKKTVYDGSYTGNMGDIYTRIVKVCPVCGSLFVSIDSYLEAVDFEFRVIALEHLMAVAMPILARYRLRIVSAWDADTITAQKQAEESRIRKTIEDDELRLALERQRGAIDRALQGYLDWKADQDKLEAPKAMRPTEEWSVTTSLNFEGQGNPTPIRDNDTEIEDK